MFAEVWHGCSGREQQLVKTRWLALRAVFLRLALLCIHSCRAALAHVICVIKFACQVAIECCKFEFSNKNRLALCCQTKRAHTRQFSEARPTYVRTHARTQAVRHARMHARACVAGRHSWASAAWNRSKRASGRARAFCRASCCVPGSSALGAAVTNNQRRCARCSQARQATRGLRIAFHDAWMRGMKPSHGIARQQRSFVAGM